ncbi:Flp family type IVb pilin [Pleomorphomonas sp. NRK KF1]|uniref:Flp family type IVb pilin n=1 Tax=Pleomorphomonas sp. NRK KF1 TaxID=2943000 RepID=UPI002042EED6|nr:Flp family type IVb pilin [Pleomorphomonas sp. NRK KF1]MCM5554194.1 Flp family type IVb pilin [Pleomorphomonas sp. NRK KF1]
MATKRPERGLRRLDALLRDTEGATAIEYGILLMMVGLALIGMMSMTDVSNQMSNTFEYLAGKMSTSS